MDYVRAHKKVSGARGKASEHKCIHRLCNKQADHWCFTHKNPNPLYDGPREKVGPYSHDPNDYQPMCRWHHHLFDMENDPQYREAVRLRAIAAGEGNKRWRAENQK